MRADGGLEPRLPLASGAHRVALRGLEHGDQETRERDGQCVALAPRARASPRKPSTPANGPSTCAVFTIAISAPEKRGERRAARAPQQRDAAP